MYVVTNAHKYIETGLLRKLYPKTQKVGAKGIRQKQSKKP